MKLLYLIDTLYKAGGMERILTEKANSLSRDYGYEVLIVTNHQKGRKLFFPLDNGVRHIDIDVNYRMPWLMPRYIRRLCRVIDAEKPDILISMCGKELHYLDRLPKTCIRIAEFHFCREMYRIKGQESRLKAMDKAVSGLDCFVALTEEDALNWQSKCRRVEHIYNPSFAPGAGSEAGDDIPNKCIAVGRLENQKNFEDLIRVWSIVHGRHPEWVLDIYGNGRQKKRLEKKIEELGLADVVHLLPATRNIADKMGSSALLLMTSIYEGFPLVMVEAASLGLPCISYRCPCGPGEFIEDGKNGYTVEVGDVESMAERVCLCIENPSLISDMRGHCRQKAAGFTVPGIMKQWDALFHSFE